MTWFETMAGNHRDCSRASAMSSETWLGAPTMHLSSDGSRPASSAARRAVSMIHWMITGSASWMITPSPIRPATALELGHLHGLQPDDAARGVAAADPHHHPTVREVLHRRVPARRDRRIADARVRDEVPELDPLRPVGDERQRGV